MLSNKQSALTVCRTQHAEYDLQVVSNRLPNFGIEILNILCFDDVEAHGHLGAAYELAIARKTAGIAGNAVSGRLHQSM